MFTKIYRFLLKLFPDRNNPVKLPVTMPVVDHGLEDHNVVSNDSFQARRKVIEKKKKLIELAKKRKADKATGINPWLN